MDVDGEGLVRRESEGVEEEYAELADLVVGFAHEGVHVEDPVEGVDLREAGDVHWETAVWEYDAEHFWMMKKKRTRSIIDDASMQVSAQTSDDEVLYKRGDAAQFGFPKDPVASRTLGI